MANISGVLIKDSFDYVLQSDINTGVVYRIGGNIPVNPKFLSGVTVNGSFTFSDGTEQSGYILTSDSSGNATWQPMSATTPSAGVTSITVLSPLSTNSNTGNIIISFTGSTNISGDYLPLSGGTVSGNTIFLSGLTANTIYATTYENLPNTLYTGDGSLNGNRIVNIGSNTLNFSSSTQQNVLSINNGSVGIGTASPASSALFEISSTTKGFLGPRMTESQRLSISGVTGLVVYQTDADEGLYIYKSFGWIQII
jgi:hypothetical protein